MLEELRAPARRLPTTGWPVGMFGRRDRLAYLLHRLGPIPARALPRLATDHLMRNEPGALTISVDGMPTVVRAPLDDPVLCPACAAVRWLWVLRHAAVFARREIARRISAAVPTAKHLCGDASLGQQQGGPAQWPLFPAIDRWGYLPLPPVPAMLLRALEEVLRTASHGGPARREAPVPQRHRDEERSTAPAGAPPPAARRGTENWHRDGIQARTQAQQSLADMTDRLDALDAAADHLQERTRQLLDDTAEDQPPPAPALPPR